MEFVLKRNEYIKNSLYSSIWFFSFGPSINKCTFRFDRKFPTHLGNVMQMLVLFCSLQINEFVKILRTIHKTKNYVLTFSMRLSQNLKARKKKEIKYLRTRMPSTVCGILNLTGPECSCMISISSKTSRGKSVQYKSA